MSAAVEATKPTEVAAPVVPAETAPAAAPIEPEVKPTEVEEPTKPTEETPKVEAETDAAAAAPAAVEEKKEEKPVEPIYSGALGYKAPGLKNIFRFSKKYFWFGEEAAVPTSSLSQYLRGEKAEVAHPTAAWSSVTGKGLLFFVKHADQKDSPAGVLNLADATELSKDGAVAFHFKLNGDKHTFEASNAAERNGWFIAVEKAIEEAKTAKEGITSSEAYKEEVKKLGKPTTLAPSTAPAAPKKSTEVTPKPAEGEAAAPVTEPTEEVAAPARAGSVSSSSDGEDKKKKASKSKSRSVSRGKRASIFGSFLGKKDKAEEKVEEKKEKKEEKKEEKAEEKEAKKEETATPAVAEEASTEPVVAAPVTEGTAKPVEETKPEEPLTATPAVEEKKVEEKPKPTKRASIFGNFVEKLKSPTHEKKEPELTPVTKESEVSAEAPKIEETPKVEEAPLAPVTAVVDGTSEAPKTEEVKPVEAKPATATTPAKEKQHFSFGKFLGGGKDKVKSPTTEKAPELPKSEETPKVEETAPAAAPVEPVEPAPVAAEPATEAVKEEKKEETPATEAATTTTPPAKKRASIFGSLGGSVKKEKDGEEKPQGLKGLFRNASKAGKSKKEKEPSTSTPAKVEETAEPVEEKSETAPVAESKETPAATTAAPTEQATIGDVVPDAVTVGQDHKSAPAVTSSA
ncbi:unnamed protein product [Periconia digitata]|uniref:PH domain-containing protein n=1 Tax=Periconia digitata TaxID=1303443 RepID=A0A9W4U303_9PLEO|nr:unnamed protein product [Periconia digitata]